MIQYKADVNHEDMLEGSSLNKLRTDARTMWAVYEYELYDKHPPITSQQAKTILAKLGEDEHIELLALGKISLESFHMGPNRANRQGFTQLVETFSPDLAVKTINRLFILSKMDGIVLVEIDHFRAGPRTKVVAEYKLSRQQYLWFFLPHISAHTILYKGAGGHILKLPLQPGVPELPTEWEKETENSRVASKAEPSVISGWESAEEVAYLHIRDLGFGNVRRAGAGADEGIDVRGTGIVAQVKMTALPVGRPVLQQLVGAAPVISRRACYSTAGYTKEAFLYAREQKLALFQIEGTGSVRARNKVAERLMRTATSSEESLAWRNAYAFADRALARMKVWLKTPLPKPPRLGSESERVRRANSIAMQSRSSYVEGARAAIARPPNFKTAREMVIHYHHAELLLAVAMRARGFRYDEVPKRGAPKAKLTTKDFY